MVPICRPHITNQKREVQALFPRLHHRCHHHPKGRNFGEELEMTLVFRFDRVLWRLAPPHVLLRSPAAAAGARISRRANAIDGVRHGAPPGRAHHDEEEEKGGEEEEEEVEEEEEDNAGAHVPGRRQGEAAPETKAAAATVFRGRAGSFVPTGRHRFPPLPWVAGGASGAAEAAGADTSWEVGGRKRRLGSNLPGSRFPPLPGRATRAADHAEETGDHRSPAPRPFQRHNGGGGHRSSSRARASTFVGSTRARAEPRGASSGGGHDRRNKETKEVETYR